MRWLHALVLLALSVTPAVSEVRLIHLGNEGFLVQSGDTKVLIDALQGPGISGYVAPTPEEREKLETAQAPFDGVDLILATHKHDDHFNPISVGRHLLHAPDAFFVSTKQSAYRMGTEFPDYAAVKTRVKGLAPAEGDLARLQHAGIEFMVLNLHHGRGRDVMNLGFIFDVGGVRFLHVGDTAVTPGELAMYGLKGMKIDVAMIPSWFLANDNWPRYERLIGARRIVAMHIPAADAPPRYFGGGDLTQETYLEWLRKERPNVMLFWKPFQEETITVGGNPDPS